jgi:hypothetical protein
LRVGTTSASSAFFDPRSPATVRSSMTALG